MERAPGRNVDSRFNTLICEEDMHDEGQPNYSFPFSDEGMQQGTFKVITDMLILSDSLTSVLKYVEI